MKEIFVVDSYAKSPEQVEILASMVDDLSKANRDICLVSHLPIPQRLINDNVKLTIYDSNNILGPPFGGALWRFLDMQIRVNPADVYHGAAVYTNLCNALRLLAHRYDWVHFIESDLDTKDVQKHLDRGFTQFKNTPGLAVIGYFLQPLDSTGSPRAIITNILSLRPKIVDLLPPVASWNDYERLCATPGGAGTKGELVILEGFMMNQLKAANIKYALLPLDTPLSNKTHLGGDYTAFKCRQHNPLFTVFVVNHSPHEIQVNSTSGHEFCLKPGQVFFAHDLSASDELILTHFGLQKTLRHPVETLRLGAFKKQYADLCPDWIDAPVP